MPKLIVDAVDPRESAVANGMNTVIRVVGGVIGAQIGAVVVSSGARAGGRVPLESGFVTAFWISVAGAVLGIVTALLIPRVREFRELRSRGPARRDADGPT